MLVNQQGLATYYEFGRYNPDVNAGVVTPNPTGFGNIRQVDIGTVAIGADGRLPEAPLKAALDKVFGPGGLYSTDVGMVSATQFNMTAAQAGQASSWVKKAIDAVNHGQMNYSTYDKNCIQFVYNAATSSNLTISATQNMPIVAIPANAAANILAMAGQGSSISAPNLGSAVAFRVCLVLAPTSTS
jgi:hypothetical protein